MRDVSLHICDILENSVKAGATEIELDLAFEKHMLTVTIQDNGPGFPPHIVDDPADPYRTTRTERPVGLGLSLLRQSAEQCGGAFEAVNRSGGGARTRASFDMRHVDALPLGDVTATVTTALAAWDAVELCVTVTDHGRPTTVLDTREVRRELDGVPLANPAVAAFLETTLRDGLAPLYTWTETHSSATLEQDGSRDAR